MRVSVRSVHLMERPHGVEDLVLDSTNDLSLRLFSETTSTQGDGLSSSCSAILAVAQVSPESVVVEGGETK